MEAARGVGVEGFHGVEKYYINDPQNLRCVKNYFRKDISAQEFIEYYEAMNKIVSLPFALFIPVEACSLSYLFAPLTVHYVINSEDLCIGMKILCGVGSVIIDLLTLPFRLILFIPRGLYNSCQLSPIKMSHPLDSVDPMLQREAPIKFIQDGKEWYFSRNNMLATEAERYMNHLEAVKRREVNVVDTAPDEDRDVDFVVRD